jgi:hypothetical protein
MKSIAEVTQALVKGEITAEEATLAIGKLTQATLRMDTGPKGTGVLKMAGRAYPLASLYRDQWEALYDPENQAMVLAYVRDTANGVKTSTAKS